MAQVYDEPRDAKDNALHEGDHCLVVGNPVKSTGMEWMGHIVIIEKLQRWDESGSYSASIKMLYANPGSTWGLPLNCLKKLDRDSAEYAMAEAADRQSRAAVLQQNAERISGEARSEMFQAQQCWARAASINAMKGF